MPDQLPLLDTVRSSPLHSSETRAMLARSAQAKRYYFDAAASNWIGTFFRENLDLVIDNLEFARAPYPVTYIEIDSRSMWAGWRPLRHGRLGG